MEMTYQEFKNRLDKTRKVVNKKLTYALGNDWVQIKDHPQKENVLIITKIGSR